MSGVFASAGTDFEHASPAREMRGERFSDWGFIARGGGGEEF
jgi:hypothetical protein